MNLPSGTVNFLFTDIEGSTRLWEQYPEQMQQALIRHDALLRKTIENNNGSVFKTVGDAFCAAFSTASDALHAALAAQIALQAFNQSPATSHHFSLSPVPFSLKVRMGLHTGNAQERDGDYFGNALNRVARLMAAANGGQILLSGATQELVQDQLPTDASLKDLGAVRLKDLNRPEHVFQLLHPDLRAEFPPPRSLEVVPNNLPQLLTSFVGREKEMDQIKTLLEKTRLLTLTGAGGCGKTRLLLQVAAEVLEQFPDGVWLVELASLEEPTLVTQTVASVLGVKEQTGQSLQQTLTERLKSQHLLLLLDNCEHLLSACAQSAAALLRSCSQMKVMITSRAPLGVAGELTCRVPSLSVPDLKKTSTPQSLNQSEAALLFIERAQFHEPDFILTKQNAPALAQLCYHLDGIPLAIELAAARVRSLSVEDINHRLDNRFRLLTGGDRTALPRQQTLRATIDWSYDLLSPPEPRLLNRLSVFRGGWTLEAAEKVCTGERIEEWEVLDLLTSLVDKSLVIAERQESTTRYRLLETVREYAWERLVERREEERVRGQHRDYFLTLAEAVAPQLTGADQGVWLERLETEHDNLRAALEGCKLAADGAEAGLRLAGALWWFWMVRGHLSEGRQYLGEALGREGAVEPTTGRAKALNGVGVLALYQGDYAAARALHEESLAIERELGNQQGIASSLNNLGEIARMQGDYAAARALHEESLAIERELGDKGGIAISLNNLGNVAYAQGDYAATRALHEESLAIKRELGDKGGIAASLNNLGNVAYDQGDYTVARAQYEESLAIRRELGDKWGIAASLNNLGSVSHDQGDYTVARAQYEESLRIFKELGDQRGIAGSLEGCAGLAKAERLHERAARLYAAAEALREAIGSPLPPNEQEEYDRNLAAVREALGEEAFTAAWAEGRAMTMEQAIEYALEKHAE